MKKTIAFILILTLMMAIFTSCSGTTPVVETASKFDMSDYDTTLPIKFEIVMESGELISGELYYSKAPITVANFVTLANDGFYDGLTIHRVEPNLLIQGGCKFGDGTSGRNNTEYTIRGEFEENGWHNNLWHDQGVISMARYTDDLNSAYSQFFICATAMHNLDGSYASFGKVTSGMDIVTKYTNVPATKTVPDEPLVIETINILGN